MYNYMKKLLTIMHFVDLSVATEEMIMNCVTVRFLNAHSLCSNKVLSVSGEVMTVQE